MARLPERIDPDASRARSKHANYAAKDAEFARRRGRSAPSVGRLMPRSIALVSPTTITFARFSIDAAKNAVYTVCTLSAIGPIEGE